MQSVQENNIIIARFFPGEDLFQSLGEVCKKHNIKTAAIVSALGQLKEFKLGYFDGEKYEYQEFKNTYELLSISGIISWSETEKVYKFHMHSVLSDESKRSIGGHLFKGVVEGTNEIVLLKTGIKTIREKDENTGLQGLSFG
jgi:predicted DNA-binding protein with PD1-like motif